MPCSALTKGCRGQDGWPPTSPCYLTFWGQFDCIVYQNTQNTTVDVRDFFAAFYAFLSVRLRSHPPILRSALNSVVQVPALPYLRTVLFFFFVHGLPSLPGWMTRDWGPFFKVQVQVPGGGTHDLRRTLRLRRTACRDPWSLGSKRHPVDR